MGLINDFVGYTDRTYEQIRDSVLTKFGYLVPEITDHTESNPWVEGISVWSGMTEMIGYYLDRRSIEVFITKARKFESGVKIARLFDYRPRGVLAASVDLVFTLNAAAPLNILIPKGTICSTADGITFQTTVESVLLAGAQAVQIPAKQWTPVSNLNVGTTSGLSDQRVGLESGIVDNQIVVTIDSVPYQSVETFTFSRDSDEVFVAGLNENGDMELLFGDGINGVIPPTNEIIYVDYFTSLGDEGNVAEGTIVNIDSTLVLPPTFSMSVNNILGASGGGNADTLDDLKRNIPRTIRTKDRAVTDQDFIDIGELKSGVARAGVNFECGTDVEVYITPDGGGYPSSVLIQETEEWYDERKIINLDVRVQGAGQLDFIVSADVNALSRYLNSDVQTRIEDRLVDFGQPENQKIRGRVALSDIYEIIENTEGVDFSEVTLLSVKPFARPLDGTITVLNWNVETLQSSNSTIAWKVRFISGTRYELFKNGAFIATYDVGQEVVLDVVRFTILASSYAVNDNYEFLTYRYNGTIQLEEPSIPTTALQYLTINVKGGL